MKDVAVLLNSMVAEGVIQNYAIFGAVAQMRYTEAVSTMDADVLVVLPNHDTLDILNPIYAFCRARGYEPEGEAIQVGDWPVQFLPTFSVLTEEALREAEVGEIDGIPLRVVRADYLAVMALSVGRPKDFARILALLESDSVTTEAMANLTSRHNLDAEFNKFREKFLND